ncbi:MAG: thioesterase family protein [Micromonosporaceae bacterium]
MDVTPGLSARVELVVGDADTAQTLGSGDVPVLGTPRVLALCEAATVAATASQLPGDSTTVGTHVELTHRAPSAVGSVVVAEATLAKRDGKRLWFEVLVKQGENVVAEGRIERVLVTRHSFLDRAVNAL